MYEIVLLDGFSLSWPKCQNVPLPSIIVILLYTQAHHGYNNMHGADIKTGWMYLPSDSCHQNYSDVPEGPFLYSTIANKQSL